jgi:hypothetical protein
MLLVGCNTVHIETKQDLGLPRFAATDPASVAILREPPSKPNIRLGEVYARPQGSPTVTQIEDKMRQAAARMGANAVVIVSDRNHFMGHIVTGPWYARQVSPDYQRFIVGVAIRYTE